MIQVCIIYIHIYVYIRFNWKTWLYETSVLLKRLVGGVTKKIK